MAAVYRVGKKWRADYTDNDGIRHRKRFSTKADADAFLTTVRAEIADGTYVAPNKIPTFGAMADAWLAGRIEQSRNPGAGYRPSTLAQWQTHIDHIKLCFEKAKATDVDADAISRAIARWRLPKGQGGRGLSPRTVGKVLTTMSRIFRYGIANRKKTGVQIDFTKVIERVKDNSGEQNEQGEQIARSVHEVSEKEVLTPEEVLRVILAAKPGLHKTLITTAIYTGARISELLALRWQHVNLDKGLIEIRRSLSTAKVRGESNQERFRWFDPKTARGNRDIPIPSQLVTTLSEWREKCPQSRFDLVFCNIIGEPCDRTEIGRAVLRPALKQAGVDKEVTPHGLRHTYASMLIHLGRPVPEVSRYLGHANVQITMQVYCHFLKPKKQDNMSDLERLIQSSSAHGGTV